MINLPEFMATKRHKNPTAIGALTAPIGARATSGCRTNDLCAFSWPTLPWFDSCPSAPSVV